MRSYAPDGSVTNPSALNALDEFAVEDRVRPIVQRGSDSAGDVFCFECEAEPEPALSVSGSLFGLAPIDPPREDTQAPLSRIEAKETMRGERRASIAAARSALVAATRPLAELARRAVEAPARSFRTRALTETALEHQEFNGFVVSVALAVTVVGYGGLLVVFWQTPTQARATLVAAARQPGKPPAMAALAVPVPMTRKDSVVQAPAVNRPVLRTIETAVARRAAFTPNARTTNAKSLTALWQRRDTRSLDRAFAMLRHETLAFRSCGLRVSHVDRAVARCEGNGTSWTIDFQRTGGRWLIARVTTR